MDLDVSYERGKGLGHKEIVNVAARLAHLACGLVGVHDCGVNCVCKSRIDERKMTPPCILPTNYC